MNPTKQVDLTLLLAANKLITELTETDAYRPLLSFGRTTPADEASAGTRGAMMALDTKYDEPFDPPLSLNDLIRLHDQAHALAELARAPDLPHFLAI